MANDQLDVVEYLLRVTIRAHILAESALTGEERWRLRDELNAMTLDELIENYPELEN